MQTEPATTTANANAATINELFQQRVQQQPDFPIFTYVDQFGARETVLTYGELDAQARAIGAHLQTLAPRDGRAIMLYPPGFSAVPAFIGVMYAGLVSVPVMPPRPGQPPTLLARLFADAQTNLVLTTSGMLQYLRQQFGTSEFFTRFNWVATDELITQPAPAAWQPVARLPQDLVFLLYTSGSTNLPKGVMLTHANLLYHLRLANEIFDPVPDDQIVSWMPLYHGGGLMGGVLNPIYSNTKATILAPLEVLERPIYWLETLHRTRAQYAVATNFLYQMCIDRVTPEQLAQLDLHALKKVFTGAEPIRAATLEEFAHVFAPTGFDPRVYVTAYSLSEVTHVSTFHTGGVPRVITVSRQALAHGEIRVLAEGEAGQTFVSCGRPISDNVIRIVDPNTLTLCPPDRIGEFWMQGPNVAPGYWNNPEATKETFQAYLADTGEGPFLRTGDLGFFYNDELYVSGRLKDMIIVRGKNYYAQDVEAAVAGAHPALQNGAAAAFGIDVDGNEELVLLHEIKSDVGNVNVDEIANAVRAAAARVMDVRLYAVVIVAANSLPRTSMGKIQRFLCRREYLAAQKGG